MHKKSRPGPRGAGPGDDRGPRGGGPGEDRVPWKGGPGDDRLGHKGGDGGGGDRRLGMEELPTVQVSCRNTCQK